MDERILSFAALRERAAAIVRTRPRPFRVAVCAAEDESTVLAMSEAASEFLVHPVLIGDTGAITSIIGRLGADPDAFDIVSAQGPEENAATGVRLIKEGRADILMKGMLPTSTFLHPIFKHESGLLCGNVVSHIGGMDWPEKGRLLLQTDGGLNIAPSLEMKKGILKNVVFVAHLLGIERPKVALLSAAESVHPKMKSAGEAAELALWAKEALPDADVAGPMAFDLAVSPEAAAHKGYVSPVAGVADILFSDGIETGNTIYKAFRYLAHSEGAGFVVGASCPVILTSRSDTHREKMNSLALAILYADKVGPGCSGLAVKSPVRP